jgi:hypothetical protein
MVSSSQQRHDVYAEIVSPVRIFGKDGELAAERLS